MFYVYWDILFEYSNVLLRVQYLVSGVRCWQFSGTRMADPGSTDEFAGPLGVQTEASRVKFKNYQTRHSVLSTILPSTNWDYRNHSDVFSFVLLNYFQRELYLCWYQYYQKLIREVLSISDIMFIVIMMPNYLYCKVDLKDSKTNGITLSFYHS